MRSFLIFAILSIAQNLHAYGIPYQTLRMLIDDSHLIVYGEVLEITKLENEYGRHVASFRVDAKLYGSESKEIIEIYFDPHMVCPEPARYAVGDKRLAFLYFNSKNKAYFTTGLSYGSKKLNDVSYSSHHDRIKEYLRIREFPDASLHDNMILKWLVKCAIDENTRHDAIVDLRYGGAFYSKYQKDKRSRKSILNDIHKSHLRVAFLDIKKLKYYDQRLLDLIEPKTDDKEILNFLINNIKSIESSQLLSWRKSLEYIAKLSKRKDLQDLIEDLNNYRFYKKEDREAMYKIVKEYAEIL